MHGISRALTVRTADTLDDTSVDSSLPQHLLLYTYQNLHLFWFLWLVVDYSRPRSHFMHWHVAVLDHIKSGSYRSYRLTVGRWTERPDRVCLAARLDR